MVYLIFGMTPYLLPPRVSGEEAVLSTPTEECSHPAYA